MESSHDEFNVAKQADEIIGAMKQLVRSPVNDRYFISWSHLISRFNDLYTNALWNYYADTSNEAAEQRFTRIQQDAKPQIEQLEQTLTSKAASSTVPAPRLERILSEMRADAALQVFPNIALEAESELVGTEYNSLVSKQLVALDEPTTMAAVRSKLQAEPDRAQRERMWRKREERKAEDGGAIDTLFLKQIELRRKMAENADSSPYLEYIWRSKHRFDYTPADALRWLEDIEEVFQDTHERYAKHLAKRLGVVDLRPWDLEVTQDNRSKRADFEEHEYREALVTAFEHLSPDFGEVVRGMAARNHLDLMSRPNKVPTNFSTLLTTNDEPLVFCNGTGDLTDLRVMLHECGHAVHFALASSNKLFFEKVPAHEFCEFAAYTLQTLGSQALHDKEVLSASELAHFNYFVSDFVLDVMRTDAQVERFQHWLYKNKQPLSIEAIDEAWVLAQTNSSVNWEGLEDFQKKGWQRTHIIVYPLYNIEYVVSWIAVLLFLRHSQHDQRRALKQLKHVLSLGNTLGLRDSFAALGIHFPFRREEIVEAHKAFEEEFMKGIMLA